MKPPTLYKDGASTGVRLPRTSSKLQLDTLHGVIRVLDVMAAWTVAVIYYSTFTPLVYHIAEEESMPEEAQSDVSNMENKEAHLRKDAQNQVFSANEARRSDMSTRIQECAGKGKVSDVTGREVARVTFVSINCLGEPVALGYQSFLSPAMLGNYSLTTSSPKQKELDEIMPLIVCSIMEMDTSIYPILRLDKGIVVGFWVLIWMLLYPLHRPW